MTHRHRRTFLKRAFAAAAAAIGAALGTWVPRPARAAEWPRDAYAARTVGNALRNLYGTDRVVGSRAIKVRAPWRVQNGAVVPVSVSCGLPDVRAISILVEKNAQPLAAQVELTGRAAPYFFVHIKMEWTSVVHFVVNAGGSLYTARRNIRVVVGSS